MGVTPKCHHFRPMPAPRKDIPGDVEHRRARSLVRAGALLSAPAALVLGAARFVVDGLGSSLGWVLVAGAAGFAGAGLLARLTGSARLGGWCMTLTALVTLSTMAVLQNGLWSDGALWLPFAPFVGTLFLGRTGALVAGIAGLVVVTGLAGLHAMSLLGPQSATGELLMRHAAAAGAIVFAAGLALVWESTRQKALAESEQMKDQFVSVVSHELRTPLTSIAGALKLLRGGAAGDLEPGPIKLIELAIRNADRLRRLIDDLLDLQKAAVGRMQMAPETLALAPLLRAAIDADAAYAADRDVELRLEGDLPTCFVYVDPARLQQVLSNLISNAMKHSPPGETVALTAAIEGERAVVRVIDRGPGVPAEFRDRLFEPFSQAESASNQKGGGTGLGLAVTRQLLQAQGGTVELEVSGASGSTFRVTLPVHAISA